MKAAVFIAAVFLIISCGSGNGPVRVSSMSMGSNADSDGNITDSGLNFLFQKALEPRRAADLINNIYFQGDCIFFNFTLDRPVKKEKISVVFSGPGGAASMPAERLEMHRNTVLGIPCSSYTVWGFSLVGSVLERFHMAELEGPAPADGYCCREIPLEISIEIDEPGGKVIERMSSKFKILYE